MTRSALAAAALLLGACARPDGAGELLQVADPRAASRLVEGWHEAYRGSWRWTEKRFAVLLNVPTAGRPATLRLKFAIPPTHIANLGPITLAAAVNGTQLQAATYPRAGDQIYTQTIPAGAMTGDEIRVEFQLDKALPPSPADSRELGVIVTSVALQ